MDFPNDREVTDLSTYLAESMIISLINISGENFKVIERSRLNSILEEHNLSASGILKEEEIKKIGNLVGADVIVMGLYYNLDNKILVMSKIVSVRTANIYDAVKKTLPKTETVYSILGEEINEPPKIDIDPHLVPVSAGTTTYNGNVTLSYDIEMGKYEVTHEDYIKFLNDVDVSAAGTYRGIEIIEIDSEESAVGYNGNRFYFAGSKYASSKNSPVIKVNWYGALAYCNWLSKQKGLTPAYDLDHWELNGPLESVEGYRLPTVTEWEYAARGGIEGKPTIYAGSDNLDEVGWYDRNSNNKLHPIGRKKPNELGIYDMSGNVWEWTNTFDGEDYRHMCGGSSMVSDASCEVGFTTAHNNPRLNYRDMGFRLTRTK